MEKDLTYLKSSIIEYFDKLVGTDKDVLPKGILSKEDEFFILHGRYIEARTVLGNHRFNNSVFVKGNAIDILGHYFDNKDKQDDSGMQSDIWECFGKYIDRSRYLEVFDKENPQKLNIHSYFANIDWEYKNGVYFPKLISVSPNKIELVNITTNEKLNDLKTKEGFFDLSKKVLNEDKANKLVDRYF